MPEVISGECSKIGNLVKYSRVSLNTSFNLPKLECTEIPYDVKGACLILLRNGLHQSCCQRTPCIMQVLELLVNFFLFILYCGILITKLLNHLPFQRIMGGYSRDSDLKNVHLKVGVKQQHLSQRFTANNLGQCNRILCFMSLSPLCLYGNTKET